MAATIFPTLSAMMKLKPLKNTGGMALGIMEDATFRSEKVQLQGGDRLFLYTDGVTEAMDEGGNQYSEPRLENFLHRANSSSVSEIVHGAVENVRSHSAGTPQSDDITVLALKFLLRAAQS